MKLEYSGCSMKGAVRRRNEDAILMRSRGETGLFLVSDGIGGSAYGAETSGIVASGYDRWWTDGAEGLDFSKAVEEIEKTLFRLSSEIYEKYGQYHSGATIVLLYIQGDDCLLLSSGDSRIYRARGFRCKQITRDDIFENLPDKPPGFGNENNGKLVAAVGIRDTVDYSAKTEPVKKGDRFFLCSDGVYKYHSTGSLYRQLAITGRFSTTNNVIGRISKEVEEHGAGDNYSMILVREI